MKGHNMNLTKIFFFGVVLIGLLSSDVRADESDLIAAQQAPAITVNPSVPLGRGYVGVKVNWPSSGAAKYELQESIDGHDYRDVALTKPNATEVALNFVLGTSHKLRIRAIDAAGNAAEWAESAPVTVTLERESSTAISWNGDWARIQSPGAPRNWGAADQFIRESSQFGAAASYSFIGSTIAWIATRGPSNGLADVYIDGVKASTIDLYSPEPEFATVAFTATGLAGGVVHKIEVRVQGKRSDDSQDSQVDVYGFVKL
jgi:hypothetical protein